MIEFGTGGWRAVIGDTFTRENLQRLALALARRMKAEGVAERGFVIGYDRRFLSAEAAHWFCETLVAEGIPTCIIPDDAPTPLIMFTVQTYRTAYGAAITASHNPAIYNGVKLFTEGGRDAEVAITSVLAKEANAISPEDIRVIPYEHALRQGLVQEIHPQNDYIDSIICNVNMDAIRSRGLRIILDPMYGVSRTSLQTILLTARCDVNVIHERHDTLFGGRLPAPNVETLGALKAAVLESHADIGIATDGDADRLGIIDETGRFIHPNEILCLLYDYLLRFKGWHGCAVRNLCTTHLLDDIARAFGESCVEVPVGFKYVSAAMAEHNALIGGESSGGLTVRGHIHGKDGIYAAALLVEMMAVTGRKLSEAVKALQSTYGCRYMTEYDWGFDPDDKPRLQGLLTGEKLPEFPNKPTGINDMDGRKFIFDNGWLIARFSGTEPRLRVFCEMPTMAEAQCRSKIVADFLGLKL